MIRYLRVEIPQITLNAKSKLELSLGSSSLRTMRLLRVTEFDYK
jgi:hypothetical protein